MLPTSAMPLNGSVSNARNATCPSVNPSLHDSVGQQYSDLFCAIKFCLSPSVGKRSTQRGVGFTILEVLGYPSLVSVDKTYFETAFKILHVFPIDQPVLNHAIKLRQTRKMTPGDAIIAATALAHGHEIYTRNISDFNWITGLKVINPIP